MRESVYIVDIVGQIASAVSVETGLPVNYVYGSSIDILKNLQDKDSSETLKDTKYNLIALYMPFPEKRGVQLYADVLIRRIVIATLTNSTDEPPTRYQQTFKPILYPLYESFVRQFVRSKYISCKDVDSLIHTKLDVPGILPVSGINDYVDSIQLENIQFSITQVKK